MNDTYKRLLPKVTGLSAITLSKSKSPEILALKKEIEEATAFLNPINPLSTNRIYAIINDIYELPICSVCSSFCGFNKKDNSLGFTKYCSNDCAKGQDKLPKHILEKLKDKDWMYERRFTEQLSHDEIGKILGCSEVPVSKWCDIHGFPKVDYKKSNAIQRALLEDKDWMFDQHKTQHKTMQEIADLIGVSKATVSVHMNNLGIEANEPNSYDRESVDVSKPCQEVIDYIKSFYHGEVKNNNRTILNGLELDIYLPEINFAIEYNGVHCHTENKNGTNFSNIKGKQYHLTKTENSLKKGIQLMHLWSCDWERKKDIAKSMIKNKIFSALNCKSSHIEEISASKTKFKVVPSKEARMFLEANHIQGSVNCTYYYGLYLQNELVSVMSFKKSRYVQKDDSWELMRFCSKLNTKVYMGFTKLLQNVIKIHPEMKSIISYADRSRSVGDVYEKAGFTKSHINPPSYWYTHPKNDWIMEHKSKYRKKDKNDPRTEEMIMEDAGYRRIWDCGTMAYVLQT